MNVIEVEWTKHVSAKTEEFREWTASIGGDQRKLHASHQQLTKRKGALTDTLKSLGAKAAQAEALRTEREDLLNQLDCILEQRALRREEEYRAINVASGGRLDLLLERGANRTAYLNAVLAEKRGSRLSQKQIEELIQSIPPRRLIELTLAENADDLAKEAGCETPVATRLIQALLNVEDLSELLALEYKVAAEDIPHIRYRKPDGEYHALDTLSVGQKCTALLIIALARGTMPVVIDQPEDALDVRSVYEDVTRQLRTRKDGRQFILTTHNATVAVAGDTDKFHILSGSAETGTVFLGGAIDIVEVRDEVIRHLEGGRDSFRLKGRKYGIATI